MPTCPKSRCPAYVVTATASVQECQQIKGPGALDKLVGKVKEVIESLQPSATASTVSSASMRPAPQKYGILQMSASAFMTRVSFEGHVAIGLLHRQCMVEESPRYSDTWQQHDVGCMIICRGPRNIGRVAIEGFGAAAWHLGMPAPEQSRQLLLAVTKISTMVKAAQCSAMITVPVGKFPAKNLQKVYLQGDFVCRLGE